MKKCPNCGNKGWKPTAEFKEPLRNFGKQKYDNFAVRYILCLNCGYRFKTIEKFHQEIAPEPNLFDSNE